MAKGAAKQDKMGRLHSLLTSVFLKTLEKYERSLDAQVEVVEAEFEEQVIADLASELQVVEISPAMLSAVAKFLNDNKVFLDDEKVGELSATQLRLQNKREARRKAGLSVVDIPLAGTGGG